MSRLVFKNHEGDEIAPVHAVVLIALVLPINLFLLSYCSMLLTGALHAGIPQFPALDFWSAGCAVTLLRVLGWKGPIAFNAPKR
jgi:hypothetical protein